MIPSRDGPLVHAAAPDHVLRTLDDGLLTADERDRCGRLRSSADRDARVAAHLLVRWSAAQLTGQAIETLELVQRCPQCGSSDHGRPSMPALPGVHVSLAHTRGAVAAAVGWDPVGVDVETARSGDALDAALLHLTLTEREMLQVRSSPEPRATFLRHWTLKECLVKVGAATLDGLSRLEIDLSTAHRTAEGRTWTTYRNLHLLEWCDPGLGAVIGAAGAAPPVVDTFPVTSSQAETGTESRWGWTAVRAGRLVTAGGRR